MDRAEYDKLIASDPSAEKFLAAIGGSVLVRLDPIKKGGMKPLADLADAKRRNDQGHAVYFHLNRLPPGFGGKAKKSDISAIRGTCADIDWDKAAFAGRFDEGHAKVMETAERLKAVDTPPTVIIGTGGGIQPIWMFETELTPTPETTARVERLGKAIRARFGGDAVQNIDRVLRLPGFTNHPNEDKRDAGQLTRRAEVIFVSKKKYTLEDLEAAFPSANGHDASQPTKGIGNEELTGGLDREFVLAEFNEVVEFLVAHCKPSPLARTTAGGEYNNWFHLMSACAWVASQRPEHATAVSALIANIMPLLGRVPDINWPMYQGLLESTPSKIAKGEAVTTPGTIFKLAVDRGWRPSENAGTADAASAAGNPVDIFAPISAPAFPLHTLPVAVRDYVAVQSQAIGADATALGAATLPTMAGAIDARMCVVMNNVDWEEPPIIRTLLVGDPAIAKSPIIKALVRPLIRMDAQELTRFQAAMGAWKASLAAMARASAPSGPPSARRRGQQPSATSAPAPAPLQRPKAPPQFTVDSVTPEKVCEILSRSPRGSLLWQDEISSLFTKMKNERDDRGVWLKSYGGGPHRKQKVGSGHNDPDSDINVENLALSMIGGITTERLKDFDLASDGMLQRFIPVKMNPSADADTRVQGAAQAVAYDGFITELTKVRAQRVVFSAAAEEVKVQAIKLQDRTKKALAGTRGVTTGAVTAYGKLRGLYGRLALVLHVAEAVERHLANQDIGDASITGVVNTPNIDEISEETALRAEELTKWVGKAIMAFYLGENMYSEITRGIGSWILTSGATVVAAREIAASVRAVRGKSMDEVAKEMSILEAAGWISPVAETKWTAAPRRWTVSPQVAALFKATAVAEAERKAELREVMEASFNVRRKARAP